MTGTMFVPAIGILSGVPYNRLADLAARKNAGRLTSAESLALAVLAGGGPGEEALGALIDAATEEFGHGQYRVPVRVVADPKRLRLFVNVPDASAAQLDLLHARLRDSLAGEGPTIALFTSGVTVDAFEIPAGEPDVVARGGE